MVILKRRTGSLEPKTQGNGGWSKLKLGAFDAWVRARLEEAGDLTLDDLVQELYEDHGEDHGLKVARSSVGYWLRRLGLSHKKRCSRPNNCARMWPWPGASGSHVVNHSYATIWKGSPLLTRHL